MEQILKKAAINTWERIGQSFRQQNVRISETTISENIVSYIYENCNLSQSYVQIFQSKNENLNGADLEFFIEFEQGYIHFPAQAKLMKSNYKYSKINYQNNNGYQIDSLLTYASAKNAFPIYLLYNFVDWKTLRNNNSGISFFTRKNYGVSIAYAKTVKALCTNTDTNQVTSWKIPSFFNLNPKYTFPFHKMINKGIYNEPNGLHRQLQQLEIYPSLRKYDCRELEDDGKWRALIDYDSIGRSIHQENNKTIYEQHNYEFRPKYRILIGLNKKQLIMIT
mgnify:CR=1 FL=1